MKVCDQRPPNVKIMLVGEAPGAEEERTGRPFVGQAGKMLRQLLSHVGINYNECYVTNVADERPPGNDFSFFYLDKKCKTPSARLEDYWDILREKIQKLQPRVVVALGGEALRAITGKRGISAWRGTPIKYNDIIIIPTFHPSYIIKQYYHHPIAELDLSKALRFSKYTNRENVHFDMILKPSIQQVIQWIDGVVKRKCRVSFDIETVGKHIRSIALAIGQSQIEMQAICIPFIQFPSSSLTSVSTDGKFISFGSESDTMSSYWSTSNEIIVLQKLAELFDDKDIQKIGQNSICFDMPLIEDEFGIYINNHYLDTMHAWHVLYPELPKSLNMLCSLLTDHPNYWTEKDSSNDMSEWKYNALDASVTLEVGYKIEEDLIVQKLSDFYFNHTHPLAIALSVASQEGVLIDKDSRDKLVIDKKEVKTKVQQEIDELANRKLNPNSHKQVQELLYEKLRFPVVFKKGKKTVDEEALRKLEKRYPNEKILSKIIEYRKVTKLISTFLTVKAGEDGKIRTSYNPSGTKTGRISSSQNLWGEGMNLQNIPVGKFKGVENIRHLFIAGSGHAFVKCDLRQAETMVVAEILKRIGDPTLSDLYKTEDFDIHKWAASDVFRKSIDSISDYERAVGKLRNHSGNYCAGPRVLMARALKDGIEDVDYQFAKSVLASTHRSIPGLRKWWGLVEMQLRRTRTITTCLGRRRIFFGRLDDSATIRDAVSFEPQSTVADVCNTIFRRLYKTLNDDCKLVLQVHDEIVVECPVAKTNHVIYEMKKASIVPLFINEKPLIIPIEVSTGKNWRDMK